MDRIPTEHDAMIAEVRRLRKETNFSFEKISEILDISNFTAQKWAYDGRQIYHCEEPGCRNIATSRWKGKNICRDCMNREDEAPHMSWRRYSNLRNQ
jgi:hypothetical protein